MDGWFAIEDRGFIRQQAGRDPVEVVREVVQNAFDAVQARHIDIRIEYDGSEAIVVVEDDGVGFNDPAQAYTVFLSGKADDPTKRGRKGRGLKEAIAASSSARIEVLGQAVVFTRRGRTNVRRIERTDRIRGSRIELHVKRWSRRAVASVVNELKTFEPPPGVAIEVNGEPLQPHEEVARIRARLQTVVVRDEVEQRETRNTETVLMRPRAEERPALFEMGLPICEVDMPWHVDVQQRIPLPDHRTAVPVGWLKSLKTQILERMADRMSSAQLRADWIPEVIGQVSEAVQRLYVQKVFGDKVALVTPGDQVANAMAKEDLKLTPIVTSHLPKSVRQVVRAHVCSTRAAVDAATVHDQTSGGSLSSLQPTDDERAVCRLAAWIASELTGRTVGAAVDREVRTRVGTPALACWQPLLEMIVFSRKLCTNRFFRDPFAPSVLGVICHEIAHIGQEGYGHGADVEFERRLELTAGKLARLLLDRGAEARQVVRRPEAGSDASNRPPSFGETATPDQSTPQAP